MARQRDYKAEYERRIASAAKRGLSRSQGRGHARIGETPLRARTLEFDQRLEDALKFYRQTGNRAFAAKAVRIAPERLRRFLRESVQVEGRGKSLRITDKRPYRMTVWSDGQIQEFIIADPIQKSLNGRHLAAVGEFLRNGDFELVRPFEGQSVVDAKGNAHPLETAPNVLHRLAAQNDQVFHEIYRLVI